MSRHVTASPEKVTPASLSGVSAAVLRAARRLGGAFENIDMLPEVRAIKGQCAYVVQSELGLLKVGSSRHFESRWVGLRAMIPHELRLVAIWRGGSRSQERAMHRALARWRVKGEWFRADAESLAIVRKWMRAGLPSEGGDSRPPPSPTGRPATARQMDVLRFIASEIERRGFPPTIREIGAAVGVKSTNGVNDHLRALLARGLVVRNEDNAARALVVTALGARRLGLEAA